MTKEERKTNHYCKIIGELLKKNIAETFKCSKHKIKLSGVFFTKEVVKREKIHTSL